MSKLANLESSSDIFNIALVNMNRFLLSVNLNLTAASFIKSGAWECVSRRALGWMRFCLKLLPVLFAKKVCCLETYWNCYAEFL